MFIMEDMVLIISVRRNEVGIGQTIDLAGKQTYMRSAKTAGLFVCMYTSLKYKGPENQGHIAPSFF